MRRDITTAASISRYHLRKQRRILRLTRMSITSRTNITIANRMILSRSLILRSYSLDPILMAPRSRSPVSTLTTNRGLDLKSSKQTSPADITTLPTTLPLNFRPNQALSQNRLILNQPTIIKILQTTTPTPPATLTTNKLHLLNVVILDAHIHKQLIVTTI